MSKNNTVKALVGGMIGGAALGILFAPKKGSETRADLMNALDSLAKKVKKLDKEDVKKFVDDNIEKIKKSLDELSVEKVYNVAKKKAKEIEKTVANLAKYVKNAGTPVLENAVDQVRLKSIDVINNVLEKLETDNKDKKSKK